MPRDYQLRVTLLQSPFLRLGFRLPPCPLRAARLPLEEIGFGPRVAGNSNDEKSTRDAVIGYLSGLFVQPARLGANKPTMARQRPIEEIPKRW